MDPDLWPRRGPLTSGRPGLFDFPNDFPCRIAKVIGGNDRESRGSEDVLALLDVRSLEPDDQRYAQRHVARRRYDPFCDDVAAHDAAEDVDQDALHGRIAEDDLERRRHLFLRGAAAYVEKVRGLATLELDDVHRCHRQAGAIHHAADRSVELDVAEVELGRFDLHRVLFREVAKL